MAAAVRTSHFPIPTPNELRHEFHGSDRFTILDMNHSFHQFEMDNASKELYMFYTPWGLHRFNTLVMGVSSGTVSVTRGFGSLCQDWRESLKSKMT